MRLFFILLTSTFISCSSSTTGDRNVADTALLDTLSKAKLYPDLLLIDTPKVLKAGEDYITIATSPHDKLYFGDKFSPYKMEPYDIADIEQIIDLLIQKQKLKGNFKSKSLADFKYQIYSVKTAKQKLQVRVQAICIDQADRKKWSSARLEIEGGGDCYFSIIYDLTDKKIISFQINSDA